MAVTMLDDEDIPGSFHSSAEVVDLQVVGWVIQCLQVAGRNEGVMNGPLGKSEARVSFEHQNLCLR